MSLNPCIVVAHNVLMVQTGEEGHLPLNTPELFAGWVHLDPFDGIVTAIQLVLDLEVHRISKIDHPRNIKPIKAKEILHTDEIITLMTAPKAPFPSSWSSSNSLKYRENCLCTTAPKGVPRR